MRRDQCTCKPKFKFKETSIKQNIIWLDKHTIVFHGSDTGENLNEKED